LAGRDSGEDEGRGKTKLSYSTLDDINRTRPTIGMVAVCIIQVEVLSESTEAYDRGRKFGYYRALESLQEYVLVSADRVQVECYRRQPEGQWLLTASNDLQGTIRLDSVGCEIRLAEIYEDVQVSA